MYRFNRVLISTAMVSRAIKSLERRITIKTQVFVEFEASFTPAATRRHKNLGSYSVCGAVTRTWNDLCGVCVDAVKPH